MAKLSLTIPTYNESANVTNLLDQAHAALAGRDFEIIIVDDDSPDRTWERVEEYAASHPRVSVIRRIGRRGLSAAVAEGFERSCGDILGVMDADLSHDPALLPRLMDAVVAGADIAVGSRRVPGGGADNWPWHRRAASDVATRFASWLLDVPLRDPMSGYFVLRRVVFDAVSPRLENRGYKILLEIVCRSGPLKAVEIPYIFRDRRQGISKASPRVGWQFLTSVLELRAARRRKSG